MRAVLLRDPLEQGCSSSCLHESVAPKRLRSLGPDRPPGPGQCSLPRAEPGLRPVIILLLYTPAHFAVQDEGLVTAFLTGIEAADLVTMTEGGLLATFLPLVFVPGRGQAGALIGHVARKNEQWKLTPIGQALVIAHGKEAYISPSWYPSKAEHGRVVPTWNYTAAHIYGDLVVHDDPVWVDDMVRQLTDRQEIGRSHPWSVDDAPPAFHEGQLRGIVGLEIVIERVEAKFKMSQNQKDANIDGVVAGLEEDGRRDVAALVNALRR
jgi:transcriptional regulator